MKYRKILPRAADPAEMQGANLAVGAFLVGLRPFVAEQRWAYARTTPEWPRGCSFATKSMGGVPSINSAACGDDYLTGRTPVGECPEPRPDRVHLPVVASSSGSSPGAG